MDAWYVRFNHLIAKGDTVVKSQGENILRIHKKDTVLRYTYSCQGTFYR